MLPMSDLGQFDACYNSEQDRILLRITNTAGEEYRLWLTRRFCLGLLGEFKVKVSAYRLPPEDRKGVRMDESSGLLDDSGASTVMQADIQQELVAARQDFGQTFHPGEQFPLGEQGELVEQVDLKPNEKGTGSHALGFQSVQGQLLTIAVTSELLNSIFEAIERVTQQADWGLITTAVSMAKSSTLQ
ncbi:MAG TPA: hypothetical protein DEF79_05720 [Gammaproteobacteria bacterium]|nr:hypothetical protein [Gammaproteobacteria bacterium]